MALYGVGLNVNVNRVLQDIRLFVSKVKGGLNIRSLFNILDQNSSHGHITSENLEKGLNQFGFFLSKVDLQTLVKYITNERNQIDLQLLKKDLIEPLNQRRSQLINKIWKKISNDSETITAEVFRNNISTEKFTQVQTKKKTQTEVVNFILSQIQFNFDNKITKQEFFDYYRDLSVSIPSDQQFAVFMEECWSVQEDTDCQIKPEEIRKIVKDIRFKLIQKSEKQGEEYLLRKVFIEMDLNRTGMITLEELYRLFIKIEIPVGKNHLGLIFEKFDRNKNGSAEFKEIINYILYDPYE